MLDELKRWEGMGIKDGLLNEFAMMWSAARRLPTTLYCLQVDGISSSARGERRADLFTRSGLLSDPNLDPAYLATVVKVAFNKKANKPFVATIKDKYYELFRGKGNLEEEVEAGAAEAAAAVANSAAGPSS